MRSIFKIAQAMWETAWNEYASSYRRIYICGYCWMLCQHDEFLWQSPWIHRCFVYKSDFNALNMCNPTTKIDHKNSSHDNHLVYCWWWWCCCWKYKTMWVSSEFHYHNRNVVTRFGLHHSQIHIIIIVIVIIRRDEFTCELTLLLLMLSEHKYMCVCVYICHLIRAIIYDRPDEALIIPMHTFKIDGVLIIFCTLYACHTSTHKIQQENR